MAGDMIWSNAADNNSIKCWNDGIALALWVKEHHPNIKLIIVSGATDSAPQLQKLGELKAAGILTEEEFAAQKAKILGS